MISAFDVSTVRSLDSRVNVSLREKGESDFSNGFCSGRPNVDVNENMIKQAVIPIATDRRNIAKLYESVQVSHGNYCSFVKFLGYLNVCGTWFARILTLYKGTEDVSYLKDSGVALKALPEAGQSREMRSMFTTMDIYHV